MAHPDALTDRDLVSRREARTLVARAASARSPLAELSQDRIDAIVDAMAAVAAAEAEPFARLAREETGFGVVADKIAKNRFASETVHRFIRPMKTVGVIRRDEARKLVEIAEPFGVVAAIVPSTNPTSTTIFKLLIALKARCPIIISPHPAAVGCITRVAEVMSEAASRAGAPDGAIGWMRMVTLEGTDELMRSREVAVILATGGMGLVRAAYSAGKPAYGVGPGNAPAYIERTADVEKAARDIVAGKTFDNGLLCSSENSVVVDEAVADEARRAFAAAGAHFLAPAETDALAAALVTPQRLPDPTLVGQPATLIAARAGIRVPPGTTVLVAPLAGVGRDFPLSIEKLCPVLSFYVVKDWREGCQRCKQILAYGGMGHTMAIHSRDEAVILEFGLKKPAFRIVVNTPATHGAIGLTTGLDPALTLGCGGYGGNITSDNISPRHLLNVKRLAYELRPARGAESQKTPTDAPVGAAGRLPGVPERATVPDGIGTHALMRGIDRALAARGFEPEATSAPGKTAVAPAEFVCEEDVRLAVREGRTILVDERTIITPSARDLGQTTKTLVHSGMTSV